MNIQGSQNPLQRVLIVEKDTNDDVILTWTFPSIEKDLEEIILSRSELTNSTIRLPFHYSRFKDSWIYTLITKTEPKDPLTNLVSMAVVVCSKTFDPEKYEVFLKLLATAYTQSGSPVEVLSIYLAVFTKSKYEGKYGRFLESEFDFRKALLASSLKEIIRTFGIESILIWTAMLMKKRIVVFSEDLSLVLKFVRGFPLFVWHRQNWDLLRPFSQQNSAQVSELAATPVYVAGFCDPTIKSRDALYDLFVDVDSKSITISENSRADFALGSYHKEIATFLVQSSEAEDISDQSLIKNLAVQTKDLIAKLNSLAVKDSDGNDYVDLEDLSKRKLPPKFDRFLFNVAFAEGMTKRTRQ